MRHALKTVFVAGLVLSLCSSIFAYSGGTGEPNDPYQIAIRADLLQLGATPADYSKSFIMTADIDLDPCLPGGQVFSSPIIHGSSFVGTFDGNNHRISNLQATTAGVFGTIGAQGQVSNLTIENCSIQPNLGILGGGDSVGALAGSNQGRIINCSSTGQISAHNMGGGLIGYNNNGYIANCHSSVSISSGGAEPSEIGGLVGANDGGTGSGTTITNCYTDGIVDGHTDAGGVGGIAGTSFYNGSMINCYSTATVSGKRNIGGLVGSTDTAHVINNSYFSGTVIGTTNIVNSGGIGGLVGYHGGTINNSYSNGTVNGYMSVGGLTGIISYGSLNNSYAVSDVNGTSRVGQLAGSCSYATFNNCVWSTDSSIPVAGYSSGSSGSLYEHTDAEMKMLSTYTFIDWDFANIWAMGNGQTYPYLKEPSTFNPADFNHDGTVNFKDFATFAFNWSNK